MLDLYELIPDPWRSLLSTEVEVLLKIQDVLAAELEAGREIIPPRNQIFSALDLPPERVRVVIVGQDPYPRRTHAMGRAFAVPASVRPLPGSLRNIFKERRDDIGGVDPASDLSSWQEQGVLLLNRVLTTNDGQTDGHAHVGWQHVTDRILEVVAAHGAVALLWGKSAAASQGIFGQRAILSAHPSPLSAHRGFFGSRPFSQANEMLRDPIDW